MKNKSRKINIKLSEQEALILFEFLHELVEKKLIKRASDDKIVSSIIGDLEKPLFSVSICKDYLKILEKERKKYSKGWLF